MGISHLGLDGSIDIFIIESHICSGMKMLKDQWKFQQKYQYL